jgi:hypothetical protein
MTGCQFIAGEPTRDEGCKCGAPRKDGSPYCPDHHAICYHPVNPALRARGDERTAYIAAVA